ncbi:MAG: hypothetical protein QM541_01520 [Flavobacterium sp.]|nr:hypothetical protein [Flavobacterium sp.]
MNTVLKPTKAALKSQKNSPLFVAIKTKSGNIVSMRQITPSEAKALRNSAYQYLA